jgi:alkaline phosphatase D
LYLKDFGYFGAAYGNTNISSYTDATTPIGATLKDAAAKAKAFGENPNSTMIGANIDVLRDAWQASKDAGKTWQVWTGATVLAPQIPPSFLYCGQAVPSALSASVQAYCDGVLGAAAAGFFRAAVAMQKYGQPWNSDDFGGFAVERAAIVEVAKDNAINPIILAGDVHDGWAWKIYDGGVVGPGKPVAVNLVCPGVTSPGWGGFTYGTFKGSPVEAALGTDGVYDMISNIFKLNNPGLVYGNVQDKGFVAVKMTPVSFLLIQAHVLQTTNALTTFRFTLFLDRTSC